MSAQAHPRRSAVFARSDIYSAAWDFVAAMAEHADTLWDADDIDELASALTDKSLAILSDPGVTW